MMAGYGIPELDSQQREIERRQRVADAMAAQGMQPLETNQMAGGYVVPVSPLAAIAKLAQTYAGKTMSEKAAKDRGGLDEKYNEGLATAVRDYMAGGSKTVQAPDIGAMTGGLDSQDMPMKAETVATDPRERVVAAMTSKYAPVRELAKMDFQAAEKRDERQENRDFRTQEAQASREARRQDLELRLQDARTTAADRIAMQRELAQMNIDARREMGAMADATRRDLAAATRGANGRPPPGYRYTPDGNLEAIPGGPADIKAGEAGRKADMRQQVLTDQADNVIDAVDKAEKLVGLTTTGAGGLLASLPMTDARTLAGHVETIKSNLGFDRLQQMRDMSPTGGALGQVAVQELNALRSTLATLDQLQKPSDVRTALGKIKSHYTKWKSTLNGNAPNAGASGDWAVVR